LIFFILYYICQKDNLNKEEIIMAKKNGFIIFGKTGSGKTILLNAIF
jgi:DNA replication protein DnaC